MNDNQLFGFFMKYFLSLESIKYDLKFNRFRGSSLKFHLQTDNKVQNIHRYIVLNLIKDKITKTLPDLMKHKPEQTVHCE